MIKRSHQYGIVAPFFNAENERYESLNKRATLYLSILTALGIAAGVKLETVVGAPARPSHIVVLVLSGATTLSTVVCLVLLILSVRIYPYRDVCDVTDLIVSIDEHGYDEEDVYSILLSQLAEATVMPVSSLKIERPSAEIAGYRFAA